MALEECPSDIQQRPSIPVFEVCEALSDGTFMRHIAVIAPVDEECTDVAITEVCVHAV